MPIYEYSCNECNEIFAYLQLSTKEAQEVLCPKCGSNDLKKLPSAFSCAPTGNADFSSGGSSSGFSGGG